MQPTVVIAGTLDTKGEEIGYVKQLIEETGCSTLVVDVGILHHPGIPSDISREQVAAAGGVHLGELLRRGDRRLAVQTMTRGAAKIVSDLHRQGLVSGILALGGGTGTHIGTGIMRSLPLGLPKVMLSTVASRDMRDLIGTKDITMMHSVMDILGLNPLSRKILANAAAAVAGMVGSPVRIDRERPVIGLTSFGFITEGAMLVKKMLEDQGYDVAPFHANGTGGMAMEDLIDQGLIQGVMDFALHEFADDLYNGYCSGIGPSRMETAGRQGIPQVVVPGGLDCVVLEFDSPDTMPERFRGRKVFWYDFRSGVRTTVEDLRRLGQTVAEKLNRANGPTTVMIPMKGWSEADVLGGSLYEPETNHVFVSELRTLLGSHIKIVQSDFHINDREFARLAVSELHEAMMAIRPENRRP
jgi:uncharacterized protein (UPF0261 family)